MNHNSYNFIPGETGNILGTGIVQIWIKCKDQNSFSYHVHLWINSYRMYLFIKIQCQNNCLNNL